MPNPLDLEVLQQDLVRLRRALHADPETGLHLPGTQRRILDALEGLPLEITLGQDLSSVTAVLRGRESGPTVLLRADMDALPIAELTGQKHASRRDGVMHACGHDLHAAMLVGAARLLSSRREDLAGNVIMMFQPGEEGHDGAGKMINEGVLDATGVRPVAAYALHVSATIPSGRFSTRGGPILPGGDQLRVAVLGEGGHGAALHLTKDPIPAVAAIVGALQTLVTHTIPPFESAVLSIGSIHAGAAGNVVPDRAELEGSLRWFDPRTRDALRAGFDQVCRSVAEAHGVLAHPEVIEYVPATINDTAEAAFAASVIADSLGAGRYRELARPHMAGEDFSRILALVPGAFIMVGACPPELDPATAPDNHSAYVRFDDSGLSDGALVLARLACRRLELAAAPSAAVHPTDAAR